jgi:DHA1 family bicyclomycin/chloramphenicol resistance-like MFS transporter
MTKRKYFTYVLVLGLLTAIGPFSIDMYLPGFQDIAASLGTTAAMVALSLSSFFVGVSVGQLLYGPLMDRYGRKKPLYVGLVLYIVATAVCMETKDIHTLIILRFIQAVGACGAQVAAMAMVRDLFGAQDSAKVFSLLLLVLGASPMIAPTAGGYIVSVWSWRIVFMVLLIMAVLITVLTIVLLPESYPADKQFSLKPLPILRNFLSVLRVRQFIVYVLVEAFAFAGLLAYVAGSPLLFMGYFHLDKRTYGWVFAFLALAFIGLSQLNGVLLRRYKSEQIVWVALAGQAVVAVFFVVGMLLGWCGLGLTIFFLFAFLTCLGFVNPNASALSLAPFSKNAGTAASLLGFFQLGVGTLASVGVSVFSNGTPVSLVVVMAVTSVVAMAILMAGQGSRATRLSGKDLSTR